MEIRLYSCQSPALMLEGKMNRPIRGRHQLWNSGPYSIYFFYLFGAREHKFNCKFIKHFFWFVTLNKADVFGYIFRGRGFLSIFLYSAVCDSCERRPSLLVSDVNLQFGALCSLRSSTLNETAVFSFKGYRLWSWIIFYMLLIGQSVRCSDVNVSD